jgi:hypothetical protein
LDLSEILRLYDEEGTAPVVTDPQAKGQ